MNAAPAPARAVLLGSSLLIALLAIGCESAAPKPDAKGKTAEAKPTAAKPTDAKSPDAPKAGDAKADDPGTKAGDTKLTDTKLDPKAGDTKLADTKLDPKADDTKLVDPAADLATTAAGKPRYVRGMTPPEGMSAEELEAFATATGDPTGGDFTLAKAFEGDPALADPKNGQLVASFDTTMGAFDCVLYEEQAPLTVANFVGLARGVRPTYDKKTDAWVTKKFFDGNIFHRVIKNFMIQTGDDTNSGRGNPGYVIVDEFAKGLEHDSAGVLSMANREKPNTGSTQFFITVTATKHLDGKHAVFGKCADAKVPIEISKVKVDNRAGDRPYEQVKINTITISRKPKLEKKPEKKK